MVWLQARNPPELNPFEIEYLMTYPSITGRPTSSFSDKQSEGVFVVPLVVHR